ncbi:MAG: dynamin [Pseudomonadota bacterium]
MEDARGRKNFVVIGIIVVLFMIVIAVILGLSVWETESERIEAGPPPGAAVPEQPQPGPVSPDPQAPSSPARPGGDSPAPATP